MIYRCQLFGYAWGGLGRGVRNVTVSDFPTYSVLALSLPTKRSTMEHFDDRLESFLKDDRLESYINVSLPLHCVFARLQRASSCGKVPLCTM